MVNITLPGLNNMSINQVFIVLVAIIALIAIIVIVVQWRRVRESQNTVKIMETEIELKKISMVEKDLESKRLMGNSIQLPKDKQDNLSNIRKSTSDVMGDVGYLHSEINERLARLEAQTEQKKLEIMLNEIEAKEKILLKKGDK
ncbi:hypothetical protein ALNOE001_14590 [Candidatus Methanobinarius endosymbioticus]|uniref:Uncharacterized protein n=1 Tax=Candidatus Methanobinarius endosymbioticus TaxID=2006182 RepID=A0A366M9K6_9EURY|nr:hypothetical protein ALNOE001_14590 [Candidatus Methanobinarius endosymbioticus]